MEKEEKRKSIRLLLLQAWRERWSDVEWGIQVKKILPHGTSGDTYNLSELVLSQALVGFSPNALMLTYLQNAVNCQLTSLASTLKAIVTYEDMTKPHCVKTLMEMVKGFLTNSVNYGSNEDPLGLAKCLLSTIKWVLLCSHRSLLQLADNKQSSEFGCILDLMCDILQVLLSDLSSRALIAVAVCDDADLYREISQTESNVRGTLTQLNVSLVSQTQRQNVDTSLKLLEKINEFSQESCGVITSQFLHNPTVNVFIQQEAILNPAGAIEPIVNMLILIEKMQCLSRPKLLCDVIRSGFLGIIDVIGTQHELKWVAFTFLKIPQIFVKLQSHSTCTENMVKACEMLLKYSALIEALERNYATCSCIQLLLDLLVKNSLLSADQSQELLNSCTIGEELESLKKNAPETTVQATPNLILRAEPTVASILKTLDAEYTKNQEPLLGVICHMMSGKSFELILAAAAANGNLRNFALKLIRFNEFAKSSAGEGSRASVTRSQLFDISFLMLCHIAQSYGLEIMENRDANTEPFFYQWAVRCLPLGQYKAMDYKSADASKVEQILSQFMPGGELKTSLVKWFDVCITIPYAVKEVLHAWDAGVIEHEAVKNIIINMKSRLCCLCVVACAWLTAYVNSSPTNYQDNAREMIAMIQTPHDQKSDQSHYSDRAHLMYSVCSIMTKDAGLDTDDEVLSGNTLALEVLTRTLRLIYKEGCVRLNSVTTLDRLLSIGGVEWFCESVVTEMLNLTHPEDLYQSVSMTLGIFLLNVEQLSMCFLNRTLPKFLQGTDYKLQLLVDPKGKALAKLTVMLISAAVQMRPYQDKIPAILKRGAKLYQPDICFQEQEEIEDVKPAKQRKEEVLTLQSEFNFDLQESMDESESYDTKDKLNQSMVKLFSLFTAILEEPVLSPRNSFILHFVHESVRCGPHSRYILQFMPSNMLQYLQKSLPRELNTALLLAISDTSTSRGRCIAANAICQAKRQTNWKLS